MLTILELCLGYVEESRVAKINFVSGEDYSLDILHKNPRVVAVVNFAKDMLAKYKDDVGVAQYKACCGRKLDISLKFCAHCGNDMAQNPIKENMSFNSFEYWLYDLTKRTCDSWGTSMDSIGSWYEWHSLKDILSFIEQSREWPKNPDGTQGQVVNVITLEWAEPLLRACVEDEHAKYLLERHNSHGMKQYGTFYDLLEKEISCRTI